jgi:hypothetical protein
MKFQGLMSKPANPTSWAQAQGSNEHAVSDIAREIACLRFLDRFNKYGKIKYV